MTAQRRPHSSSLTQADQRKLVKQEEKRRIAEQKEAEWQKEVVRVRGGPDIFMLTLILILLALGTIMVFSSSYPLAIKEGRDSNYYITRQIIFLIIGGAVMTLFMFFPIKWYKGWAPIIAFAVSCVLLAYTAVAGLAEGETQRWISVFGVFNLQPSELMKISIILMFAWYADKYEREIKMQINGKRSKKWNVVYPLIICIFGCGLVMAGRHLSGTIIVAAIALVMLVIAGIKMSWFLSAAVPLAGGLLALFLSLFPYALKRITTFMDEDADVLDALWQTTQSIYAIGSGGLFGLGLGQSRQKYSYLSNAHTDFIFSIWCEELGFIGAVALIILYLLFVWRGYTIAIKAPDRFTMLTAFGITTHVGLQAFLNMCVAADIIPNTGITLPFFSYGGSSLVVLMMEMGILLCISRQSYRKKSDIEQEEMRIRAGLD